MTNPLYGAIPLQPAVTAAPLATSTVPTGLSASQVRQAYGLGQVQFQAPGGAAIVGDGTGQTIAIVVAYDNPTIAADLRAFDQQMSLPDPPSFTKYAQSGLTQTDPGWSLETALDVEWAHAMAPGAKIALVEAGSASLSDLFNAVNFARNLSGVSVVSMSWGAGEFYGETAYDSLFTTPAGHIGGDGRPGGVSFVAASGDGGAWSGVSYPAASPNVLSVGATALAVRAGSGYAGETAWTGSTGGFSALEPTPAYQTTAQADSGLAYGQRTVPDVAAVGDPRSGVSVYSSVPYGGNSGWFAVGGTSAAAPQWAGLLAVADQGLALGGKGSLANAQAAVYALPSTAFHDVASGFNGYSATTGYDLVTGRGSPIASQVIGGLLATQGVRNVVGAASPAPSHAPAMSTTHLIVTVTGDGSGQVGGSGTGSSSIFTSSVSNVVVIIVPVGNNRVVLILPLPGPTSSSIAAAGHPAQPPISSTVMLPGPSLSVVEHLGQSLMLDPWLERRYRLASHLEIDALVDLVEPPSPVVAPPGLPDAGPGQLLGADAVGSPSPLRWPLAWPSGPGVDLDAATRREAAGKGRRCAVPGPSEVPPPALAPRLAAAGVLAGAAWTVTVRSAGNRARENTETAAGRRFRPRLRRLSRVGR